MQHPPRAAAMLPPAPGGSADANFDRRPGKKRGSYNCGLCGQPKKGHVCTVKTPNPTSAVMHPDAQRPVAATHSDATRYVAVTPFGAPRSVAATPSDASRSASPFALREPPSTHLRRALWSDEKDNRAVIEIDPLLEPGDAIVEKDPDPDPDLDLDLDSCGLPSSFLWEVMKRLPPVGLLTAASVSRGWREMSRRIWKAAEELKVRVPKSVHVGYVSSMLQKCPGILRLSLTMECNFDSMMLACIAFSCPNLEHMEISMSDTAINRINGDELGRFVADKKSLQSLKMEGCSHLGGFVLCSSSLSTLWLSNLHSLSKMVFNCPQLKEISLEFARRETESTNLTTMIEGLGRSCLRLQNLHIASLRLTNASVLALTAAQLRDLRMLSLVLGSEITDASVAAIAATYPNLEMLDLSGSGISDSGIELMCNVFPGTLSRLHLALCPNVTPSGIQFAMAQLPLLELMDCGMTICDPYSLYPTDDENNSELPRTSGANLHLINQKLIIKHSRLKKLSLWGCSGLDGLYLNCPQLNDLNLTSCRNLHPEKLLLQCPVLENVHASGCQATLVGAIQSQVCNAFSAMEHDSPSKRLPDGSKRVRVPYMPCGEYPEPPQKRRKMERKLCSVVAD